jgi:hypothetical protein
VLSFNKIYQVSSRQNAPLSRQAADALRHGSERPEAAIDQGQEVGRNHRWISIGGMKYRDLVRHHRLEWPHHDARTK